MSTLSNLSIAEKTILTIRTLAIDAVQKANSGHPGTPMALAPIAYLLWNDIMRYNPRGPQWINRDRFVLSNGHASMLQYPMLYLYGYGLTLDDLKEFRQLESRTPGHPEYGMTPGVETTTGPLGQGFMNAVGMALAEAHLAATFNRDDHPIIDHYTYALCSDGDLMEGASHEAASLAGHWGLSKLICIYDDNHISIEGETEITYSDDVEKRFAGYRWHTQDLGEKANDLEALAQAINYARAEKERPSLILVRSHIGYGSPNMQDTPEVHGSPLGEEEVRRTKAAYGWPEERTFFVPEEVLEHTRQAIDRGQRWQKEWQDTHQKYEKTHPQLARRFSAALENELPEGWDADIPHFQPQDGPMATRGASGTVINSFAEKLPWLVGGSADLAPSTKTLMENSQYLQKGQYEQRNIAWGVREHAMCGVSSGMYLHGGVRPFAATFFIFTDYARPAIRLAAMMELPIIYVLTHDSIGLGEDGPTHQPIEHLASLRAMPNMCLIRPADANETADAWRAALQRKEGPTMLVLTRQKLPVFDRRKVAGAEGLLKGAYVLSPEQGDTPGLVLMASGSEVSLILDAQEALRKEDIDARVVSMPSWELFRQQPATYQRSVLPPQTRARLAVEAAAPQGWREWTGEAGDIIGMDSFGVSAPYSDAFEHFGFTVENVVSRAKKLVT